ncbi:MAG: hypothetical protein P8J51_00840 [Dehalococcoidia bacterium]|jgi:hypothetical protein|nr:hypothetical protein [Dehalococcoidia bacterium]
MVLRPEDQHYIDKQKYVAKIYINNSYWWQNASFVLPFILGSISLLFGIIFNNSGAKGFGIFLLIVMIIMLPVVWLTWKSTATSIYLTNKEIVALHLGKLLKKIQLDKLQSIATIEYLGNKRYKLVESIDSYLTIDSEFNDIPQILEEIEKITGIKT